MGTILTLAKKELRDLFSSPIAYVFIAVFLFLSFWFFFSSLFLVGQASLRGFFGLLPILFVVFLPSVTMGQWAEEQKTGTIETLMTLPASEWQILLGKFTACKWFILIVLFLTIPLPVTISFLGDLDWGVVWGSYLGAYLLALSYAAIGLFISSLTRNQIVAFLVSVLTLFVLYVMAEPIITSHMPPSVVPYLQFVSLNHHYQSMARGVIDSRDVVFFLSVMALFFYLNRVSLESRQV